MHTRGRPCSSGSAFGWLGTTHAHAGQTICLRWGRIRSRNHPCTRGADQAVTSLQTTTMEPPMHTRGRLRALGDVQLVCGTTHAHAGQTHHLECLRLRVWEPPMHTRGRRLLTRYNARMSAKLYSVACIMQWMGRRLLIYGDPLR